MPFFYPPCSALLLLYRFLINQFSYFKRDQFSTNGYCKNIWGFVGVRIRPELGNSMLTSFSANLLEEITDDPALLNLLIGPIPKGSVTF